VHQELGCAEVKKMSFQDISSRLRATRGQEPARPQQKPVDFEESYRIRGKMIGVLLRDARQSAGRTPEDCARMLHVAPDQVAAWELGESVPSLPQLELLAYYLDVPVSHFWGMETLEGDNGTTRRDAQSEYLALRDRMVGVLLRQAREEQGISLDDLSAVSGLPPEQINRYELGETPLPMHELSVLASGVRKNPGYFLESSSYIGQMLAIREDWKQFASLPEDVRQFAADPINLGFIEIAMMFKQMPTDKLRRIAESMLEITM
jgi:transcriptional regulator with XRE-family HTH domain